MPGETGNSGCETCTPASSTRAWIDTPVGTSCGTGKLCNFVGGCAAGCYIAGGFYTSGTVNSNNICQSCQPAVSTSDWSPEATGKVCGTLTCSGGECGTQCVIGGVMVASGAANPANPCQSCQPGVSTSVWSDAPSCTGGCTGGVCTVDCSQPGQCDGGITCPPGVACTVSCNGTQACDGTIVCPIGFACDVECTGVQACLDTPILCGGSTTCSLTCSDTQSCVSGDTSLICGSSACTSSCTGVSTSADIVCGSASSCTLGGC